MCTKKIAIIGSGPSGLGALKTALDFNFKPVLFEKNEQIGGLWSPGHGTWSSMHTNISRYCMLFSDFNWPKNSLLFPKSGQVYKYLQGYANKFDLLRSIRLNTEVESARRISSTKQWEITSFDKMDNSRKIELFDFLLISSGHFGAPNIPFQAHEFSKFKGKIIHSFDYRSYDECLKDKNVIVIGNSYSAVEISTDLVGHASQIINIFRSPHFILPKIIKKITKNDKMLYNVYPSDFYNFARINTYVTFNNELDKKNFLFERLNLMCPRQIKKGLCHPELFIDLNDPSLDTSKVAFSDKYLNLIDDNLIKVKKSTIKYFEENGVILEDNSFMQADAIIFCTGFDLKLNLKYLEHQVLDKLIFKNTRILNLYKDTWHQEIDNLAFCGINFKIIVPTAELQAKWIFSILSGKIKRPSREEIIKEPKKIEEMVKLFDDFADLLKIKPDFEKLKVENKSLYDKIWNNIMLYAHFMLDSHENTRYLEIMNEVECIKNKKYTQEEAQKLFDHNLRH